jgi:hypothetical protein
MAVRGVGRIDRRFFSARAIMNVQYGQPAYLQVQIHSWKPAGRERPVRAHTSPSPSLASSSVLVRPTSVNQCAGSAAQKPPLTWNDCLDSLRSDSSLVRCNAASLLIGLQSLNMNSRFILASASPVADTCNAGGGRTTPMQMT